MQQGTINIIKNSENYILHIKAIECTGEGLATEEIESIKADHSDYTAETDEVYFSLSSTFYPQEDLDDGLNFAFASVAVRLIRLSGTVSFKKGQFTGSFSSPQAGTSSVTVGGGLARDTWSCPPNKCRYTQIKTDSCIDEALILTTIFRRAGKCCSVIPRRRGFRCSNYC